MKRLFWLLLLSSNLFALISITPVEVGERAGSSGDAAISLSTKRGNSNTDVYKGAFRYTYDNNATFVTWAQIQGEYGKASGVKNVQKAYLHYRFIHNITDIYHVYEIFLQSQEDKFKSISKRRIAGGGGRVRLFRDYSPLKFFLGFGAMFEYIGYTTDVDPTEKNVRLNGYVALTYPYETIKLSYTSYYQPKVDDIGDFVTANKLELQLKIYKELYLNLSISYNYDSKPAIGVNKYDFTQDTIFLYRF